ncbi:ABC transporter permease [Nocardia mangyaensis]|uniref:ABC transporter permease n=1 Tax=Nocardia mangyaensis TaxID=2213200 RepID=A0A1J0VQE2_9NOCA|nr:MFS transporter [Nocardia mangyaensis]APE34272.1 ABC transporter permease [Nocardia mangyaensis]
MANPYRELFAAPGAVAFTAAGIVARVAMPMVGIGLIAMLSQLRGDYLLAGAVSACFTLSMALLGPRISRLVDRRGQSRILLPATGISVAALGALLLAAGYGAPAWLLFGLAIPSGCIPSMSALIRSRWTEILAGSPRLHTAFSFESVVDEMTFVFGPALSVALCTILFPQAGPLVAAVLLVIGGVLVTAQRGTEPAVRAANISDARVGSPSMIVLVLALVAGGTIVGTIDVVSVAFAERQGSPAAAGLVVSVYAFGSAVAGLVFGTLELRIPLPRLLLLGVTGTAITTVPLVLVSTIAGLAIAVFLAGVFFAPTMIVIMTLVEKCVPASALTEGMTWAITGLNVGVAAGAAATGLVVDLIGAGAGSYVALGAGLCVVAIAAIGLPVLGNAVADSEATPSL